MAHHDDLLSQAQKLAGFAESEPCRADLRRAVSAAYYALFHLLINEASLNWRRESSRAAFGRMFEHGVMRRASQRTLDSRACPFDREDPEIVSRLRAVAQLFVELQNDRHVADYHNGVTWARSDALVAVATAREAFDTWASIRDSDLAQEYLVSLLIKQRD